MRSGWLQFHMLPQSESEPARLHRPRERFHTGNAILLIQRKGQESAKRSNCQLCQNSLLISCHSCRQQQHPIKHGEKKNPRSTRLREVALAIGRRQPAKRHDDLPEDSKHKEHIAK